MALTLADIGADAILKSFFKKVEATGGDDLTMRLYTNNYTPTDSDTLATYTEASGGGYAAKTLTAANWTVAATRPIADATYAQQTFSFTGALDGGATIYGYTVEDDDAVLIWAEKLSSSYTPATSGDELRITPKFQMSKGTPT